MKNLRNRNQPVNADLVQVYLQSSWDIVTAVYAELDNIQTVADAINSGGFGDYLTAADIDTLAELNAILTDATLGDAADFATAAQGAKVDFLTVTQPVDLDQLEARVNDLDAAVVLRGTWDASSGTFPGSGTAQAGDSWIVNVAGTVDSVDFAVDDRIIAILDNASTNTFAGNWHKADYTDLVTSIAGLTGAITATALRTAINVEDGATADQTDAEIRAAVEAATDSNVFTDADHSKLDGIESAATADQTDAEIKTAYENLTTVVSQAEAEAGVATTVRLWTAERVAQAIAALGGRFGKFDATTDPTINDDTGDGYVIGSLWVNVTADTAWICLDNSSGAAVWTEITQAGGGGGGMTVTAVKTANYTASANEVVPVDTTGGAFTVTLPATPGRVIVMDIGKNCRANNLLIARNGNMIDGVASDFILDQDNGRVDFVDDAGNYVTHVIGTPDIVNLNDFTGFAGINAQTGTTYTFVDGDLSLCVTASNAAASTYSIPDGLAVAGETLSVLNIGAGTVTIDCPGTDTLASTANDLATGKAGTLLKTGTTTWWLIGGA